MAPLVDGKPGEIHTQAMNRRSKFGLVAVVMLALLALYNVACLVAALCMIGFIGLVAHGTPLGEVWWVRILVLFTPEIQWGASLDAVISHLWSWARGPVWLTFLLATAGNLAFALWLLQAHRELKSRGSTSLRHASHWAITGFFVPVLQFYRPYQVTRDVCRGSGAPEDKPWVRWWWEFFLLAGYFGAVNYRILGGEPYPEAVGTLIGWHLFGVLAAVFGIVVVRSVERASAAPVQPVPAVRQRMKGVLAAALLDGALIGGIFVAVVLLFGKSQMTRRLTAMEEAREARRIPVPREEQAPAVPEPSTALAPKKKVVSEVLETVQPVKLDTDAAPVSSDAPVGDFEGVPGGVAGGEIGGVIGGFAGNVPENVPAPEGTESLVVPWVVMASKLIHRVEPVSPPEAEADGLSVMVVFKAVIAADGTVQGLTVVKSARPEFDQAAREAVMQWEFQPMVVEGRPVSVMTSINILFTPAE